MSYALGLSPQQLAEVFPFHVAVDRQLLVLQYGRGLSRLFPDLKNGRSLGEFFRVARPRVALEFEAMLAQRRSPFVLEALGGQWRMRGQVLSVPEHDALVFLGSPWVTDTRQLAQLGLTLADFAIQDPMVDSIFLLQELNTALADARRFGDAQRQKLLQSQQEFRQVIERLPDGIALHRGNHWVYVNPAFARSLGYENPEALVGQDIHERVPPESRSVLTAPETLEEALPPREHRFQRQDGKLAVLQVTPLRVAEFEGAPATLLLVRDLTEQKMLQARLMLADRMASVGTLASGVAHEINNPLAYLAANLRFIQERLVEQSQQLGWVVPPDLSEALVESLEATERVRMIGQDLRTFAREGDEQQRLIDVHRVIDSAAKIAWREIKNKGRLVKDYQPVVGVVGNESRLGQVLLNLLVNAAHALTLDRWEYNEIRVVTRMGDAEKVYVEVHDTGTGIAPEHLSRIFEPLFTTKPVGVGTGLGLSICQDIINTMGGHIQVESTLGKGTMFRLVLPAAKDEPEPEEPELGELEPD
jgi:PAS domain S-box-containing protein